MMTTNPFHRRPFLWLILAAVLMAVLLLSGLLVDGRAASLQSNETLRLLREDGEWLVLYAAADTDLDLNGFEFIVTHNNENFRFDPTTTFDVLQLNSGRLQSGTCLVIQRHNTDAPLPSECNNNALIFVSDVAQADVFWFDLIRRQSHTINVLQNGITIAICNPDPRCNIDWNPLPPVALTPVTPNFILPGYDNTGNSEAFTVDQLIEQTGIRQWQANFDGTDVKIGIIDRHFGGISTSGIDVSLPPNTNYDDDNLNQGLAVLEIIHTIAPQADFFACRYETFSDFHICVDWMIDQHVQIINHSASVPISQSTTQQNWAAEVQWATDNHILWIDAASNYKDGIIQDIFYDGDIQNGRHEFVTYGSEVLGFSGIGNTAGTVMLAWDDLPNRPANTLDLDLVITDKTTGQLIAQSSHSQSGEPSDEPFEIVTFDMRQPFGVQILNSTGTAVERLPFVLYVEFAALPLSTVAFTTPADSPFALTIGVGNQSFVANYSLHGSINNRIVPDLVAPGNVMLADGTQFIGTSAAAPIVTGYAALVLQSNPSLSNQELREFIQIYSTQDDPFNEGRDTTYGDGYLAIPPPTIVSPPTETPTPLPNMPTVNPTLTPSDNFPVAIVIVERANLRAGPHVTHPQIGMAVQGDTLPIAGQAHGWYQISGANTEQAWIAANIVVVRPENAQIPLINGFPTLLPTTYPEVTNTFPSPPPTKPGHEVPGVVVNTPTIAPRTPQSLTPVITTTPNVFATQTAVQGITRVFTGLTLTATFWTNTPSPTNTFAPSSTPIPGISSTATPSPTRTLPPSNTSAPLPPTATVKVESANLRSGPGTVYSSVGTAPLGRQYTIIGSAAGVNTPYVWYCVANSPSVWIASTTVNISGSPITGSCTYPAPPPPPDRDGDGIPDSADACPDQGNQGNGIDATGCPIPLPPPPLTLSITKTSHNDLTPPCLIDVHIESNRSTQGNVFITNGDGTTYQYPPSGMATFPTDMSLNLGGNQPEYYNHNIWVTAEGITANLGTVRCDTP